MDVGPLGSRLLTRAPKNAKVKSQRRHNRNGQNQGFSGVSRNPQLRRSRNFFIFLGHDPLFATPQTLSPADPESIQLNRETVLTALDLIFSVDKARLESIAFYRQAWAEALWLVRQLKAYLPKEPSNQVQVEYEVNRLDPDFSFYKAVFAKEPKPLIPLGERLREHSSTG